MSRRGYPKSETKDEYVSGQWFNMSTGEKTSEYENHFPYVSLSADKVGPNSPGFPAHKDNTSYSAYRRKTENNSPNFRSTSPGTNTKGSGNWPMSQVCSVTDLPAYFHDVASAAEADAYNKCVAKLISNVKNQKLNVAQFAAEFKKTCSLVASTANRISDALREFKKGHFGNVGSILGGGASGRTGGGGRRKRKPDLGDRRRPKPPQKPNTKTLASDVLAFNYGVKPLVSDIYGACEELANRMTYQPPVYRAKGRGTATRSSSAEFVQVFPSWPPTRGTCKFDYVCNGVIEYRVRAEWADIARTTGMINPLAVAWELVPYSFVVDWFYPVGSFLTNLDYDQGIEFSKGWISTKAKSTYKAYTIDGNYTDGNTFSSWSGGNRSEMIAGYRRDALGSFPNVPPPVFKDPRSLAHAINAIALLRVALD